MPLHGACLGVAAWLLAGLACVAAVHHEGDFIHTSRRSQFLKSRTHWHDLTEHHCPRFGHERTVAIPVNKPTHLPGDTVDDYKMQLSFDGDRVMTPWLTIIGKRTHSMPLVDVQLRRAGDELKGAKVKVLPLPDEYLMTHSALYDEFHNVTHWPKHVLVHYHFHTESDIDFDRGLYVLLIFGLSVSGLVALNALAGLRGKLSQFVREVVAEADPLLGISTGSSSGNNGSNGPPFVSFKRSSHAD